ncbi:MAG: glycosyltransferase family 2 protein [Anaerolineaceae bacterium]
MINLSVIILTFNSELTIENTLASVMKISSDIHIVDSFSTDRTLEIARRPGVNILQHEFKNYSAQRNWVIENLNLTGEWQLHLDADERLSDGLIAEINRLSPPEMVNGYLIARLVHFLGRPILHGGMFPIWHMRLFRNGLGRCEDRLYDQHFIVSGQVQKLSNPFIDDHRNTLAEWTTRHNKWSEAEASEILMPSETQNNKGRISGNPIEQKRAFKGWYYRFPLFCRAFLLFFYRYIILLGFLDGKEGLVFFILQTFWFRFLVDAKLFEALKSDHKSNPDQVKMM